MKILIFLILVLVTLSMITIGKGRPLKTMSYYY